ncbi:uncharacterized protein LOC122825626 [Gambusia affinis]|uniref:uncharacterized protein LOC122825626 n=1 Tax=Gambusia affinis TaxID=33528 RepID=UPI001CDCB4DD|nr:uncharacterized protein LOC122825626 [Gambusia affinis]XP_043963038.1 uncharacterized protein LOC122825626 [Gambusia affinis]XP_043963039.1 uncharacterized protein LOC122825626 [Gambusia affinis]
MATSSQNTKTSSQASSPASKEVNIKYEELSLGLLNINGLRKKTHEVKHIIARDKLHVVALCETKLNSKVKHSEVYIPGFSMWRKDRNDKSNNTGGGIALYIQDHIKTRLRPDLMTAEVDEENPEAEIIWVELDLPKAGETDQENRRVLLGCCYRPTKDKKKYLKHIKKTITLLSEKDKDKDIFLMGDFNIDWLSNSEKKEADDFISSKGWTQIVKVATRLTLDSETCIDHIYTNVKGLPEPKHIPTDCSDHNLITVKIDGKIPQSKGNFRPNQDDKEKFQKDMKNKSEEVYRNVKSLQEFTESFLQVADKHAPLKSQNIHSLLKLNETLENLVSDRDKSKYEMIKNIYTSIKKKKKLQEKIDNYINGKPENQPGGENDATESEETFPFHLPEVKASEEENQQQTDQTSSEPTDSGSVPVDPVDRHREETGIEVFQKTRFTEVKSCLEYICGHVVMFIDETEAAMWELAAGSISAPLRKILNGFIKTGEIPNELKKIKSFPFSTDNYNDIRQKSGVVRVHIILSYIFDLILYEQAKPFFIEDEKSIATLQKNLKQLKTDLGETNRAVEAVLLDFTSYFDKISHDLLITKLKESNLSESDFKLIKSFLSIHEGSSGLPGGSCLTQLLHIIIINDLKKNLEPSAVICNSYMMIYGNKSELNEKIKTVRTWADKINIKIRRKEFKPSDLSAMFKILDSMIRCHGNKSNWIRAPGNIVKQNGDWEYDNVSKELELHFGKEYIVVEPEIINNSAQESQTRNKKRPAGSAGDADDSGRSMRREI